MISYENEKLTDAFVVLVTNCLDWNAKRNMIQEGKDVKAVFDYLFFKQIAHATVDLAL